MTDPRLIELARVGAGLTQGALAAALGKTQPFISQIERGERPLPEDLIADWAKAFEVAPAFFRRTEAPMSGAVAAMVHRRLKTLPTKPFNVMTAQVQIAALEIDSLFSEVEVTAALELPLFPSGTGAADAAGAARRAWRIPDGPITNLTSLVESAGVLVMVVDGFHEKHSGVSQRGHWFDWVIMVNANHPASRRRFTLSHELGHIALGHDGRTAADSTEAKSMEDDANAFGAALLLPERNAVRELRNLTLRRAYECEVISERDRHQLYMEVSSLPGGRRREPAEFAPEEPTLINKMISSLRSVGLSSPEVADAMTTSETRLRTIYLHERSHLRPLRERPPRARVRIWNRAIIES